MPQMMRVSRNNTAVGNSPNALSVTLHSTVVVLVDRASGVVHLDSGGWRTTTTKNRMNQASNEYGLGFQVSQKDGAWTVYTKGEALPFSDGMTFPL
jgi:hypothetical protein